jgi:zinc protease
MIPFQKFTLANGLRVIVHEDPTTPMAAVNVLYDVGARDENPEKTGFAHLFEHLMFGGSQNIPNYDEPLQNAGGESNAFTNNDITNFYQTLPAQNLELAFWLESDRMNQLAFSKKSLNVQRKVVVEEFKETTLDTPYGDVWHELMGLCYTTHPYQWPTIGKIPKHVEDATLDDVKSFFYKYYRPNNAVLTVAGGVTTEQVRSLAEKWFGDIPQGDIPARELPQEPQQTERRFHAKHANVPADALYMAFPMSDRADKSYYVADLITEILSTGASSRLYRSLVKDERIFAEIDAYITGSTDAGLIIIEGKPANGVSLEDAEKAVWKVLDAFAKTAISDEELLKIRNKAESSLIFSEMGILNKAMNLAHFELLGDANAINTEGEMYQSITAAEILAEAQTRLQPNKANVLYYYSKQG